MYQQSAGRTLGGGVAHSVSLTSMSAPATGDVKKGRRSPVWLGVPSLAALLAWGPIAPAAAQPSACADAPASSEAGLVSMRSKHPVADTISRFEAAVQAKEWVVFAALDHAAAANAVGLQLRPRTVILFGNPRAGTLMMQTNPTLAIDLPLRALVWQDNDGTVWLTYNSAAYLASETCPRHGLHMSGEARGKIDLLLADIGRIATE